MFYNPNSRELDALRRARDYGPEHYGEDTDVK